MIVAGAVLPLLQPRVKQHVKSVQILLRSMMDVRICIQQVDMDNSNTPSSSDHPDPDWKA